MNRFIKKNIMLVLVFSVALVLVAFLLVLAAIQHARMASYMKKTTTTNPIVCKSKAMGLLLCIIMTKKFKQPASPTT